MTKLDRPYAFISHKLLVSAVPSASSSSESITPSSYLSSNRELGTTEAVMKLYLPLEKTHSTSVFAFSDSLLQCD